MCGIIGYTGRKNAADMILEGLQKLQYRGYDSAGISVFSDYEIKTVKTAGRIEKLIELVNENARELESTGGIGHTRWATHGIPSSLNAHPHTTERVSVVHNGIIENYLQLREYLVNKNYSFKTQTDSETVAYLLDYYYNGNPVEAISKTISRLEGSYALAIMFKDNENVVFGVRKECPLLVAVGEGENFIASDMSAVLCHTRNYYLLEEKEIACITKDKATIYDIDGNEIEKQLLVADWDVAAAEKCGYDHFMIKEINEQPQSVLSTISPRIIDGLPNFGTENISDEYLSKFEKIFIVACGTAMHAGIIGKTLIEKLARIPVEVEIASEFRYKDPVMTEKTLVIVISQSGETADTLASLRLAKSKNISTIAVVNVIGSSISREADKVINTFAGPEISVASTKAYSVQVATMYLLAIRLGLIHGKISQETALNYIKELVHIPNIMKDVMDKSNEIKHIAGCCQNTKNMFFLGRGLDYALSLEGALKLKEISYIHCEPYAAGELKHGTISLITDNVPVVCIVTQKALAEKMISNVKEVKSRGALTIFLVSESINFEDTVADYVIRIPDIDDLFSPLITIVALQLFAYHMAVIKGCDVDKPRNLAKSVTVE